MTEEYKPTIKYSNTHYEVWDGRYLLIFTTPTILSILNVHTVFNGSHCPAELLNYAGTKFAYNIESVSVGASWLAK